MINPIEYLMFQARTQPEAQAIQQLKGGITYGQLLSVVRKTAGKIRNAGIRPGHVVVTCLPERLGWIMTLALFHEAAISCSNHGYAPLEPGLGADWVISNQRSPEFAGDRTILIDQAWLGERREETTDIGPNQYASEASICRLVLTSGTTGQTKAVPYSIAMLRARLGSASSYWSSSAHEANMMPLCTVGGFLSALNCAAVATPFYVFSSAQELVSLLQTFKVAGLTGSPAQLAMLVKSLADNSPPFASLTTVRYAGSSVSPALLEQLKSRLCRNVMNVYGSTEVGGVCSVRAQQSGDDAIAAGYPVPTAEVEVVDELGQPLGVGQEGVIRTRSLSMACEYFRNPEESRKFFRDGWFYPGDRGRLLDDGLLVLAGRESELINCGGVKVDPAQIDQWLLDHEGVIDAAAFGIKGKAGMEEVGAALVIPEGFDLEALHAALLTRLGKAKAPKQYFRVAEIPRNEMGKVVRAQLGGIVAKGKP